MEQENEEEFDLHEEAEIIDGIPTFDDIIADPYYKRSSTRRSPKR